ncbi:hypothetical protein L226DRAFT_52661 [Lentinus tigrinus ALCF2SS1-7]|uniref:uncharacterized protein n=1 Tax=Lentinus tigrinus ALCF2SS1-7 TaxID=1328758 RepID=UPI0011661F68|nr:hypothetical protein L226DRAFT_52661 [Lentinus tigrinus ALCF2SS1-7]
MPFINTPGLPSVPRNHSGICGWTRAPKATVRACVGAVDGCSWSVVLLFLSIPGDLLISITYILWAVVRRATVHVNPRNRLRPSIPWSTPTAEWHTPDVSMRVAVAPRNGPHPAGDLTDSRCHACRARVPKDQNSVETSPISAASTMYRNFQSFGSASVLLPTTARAGFFWCPVVPASVPHGGMLSPYCRLATHLFPPSKGGRDSIHVAWLRVKGFSASPIVSRQSLTPAGRCPRMVPRRGCECRVRRARVPVGTCDVIWLQPRRSRRHIAHASRPSPDPTGHP